MPAQSGSDAKALMMFEARKKSAGTAFLLWIFLGGAGAHRFYLGRASTGIAMLVGLLCGVGGYLPALLVVALVAIIDVFRISGWVQDHNEKLANRLAPAEPLSPKPPPLPSTAYDNAKWKTTPERPVMDNGARWGKFNPIAAIALIFVIGLLASSLSMKGLGQRDVSQSSYKTATTPSLTTSAPEPKPEEIATTLPKMPQALDWSAAVVEAQPTIPQQSPPVVKPISVPTDLRATYTAQKVIKTQSGRARIISRRDGPSGISYQHRECDCASATYRTLGDGSTLDQMKTSPSETKMTSLVMGRDGNGSISFHVCDHACSALGATLNRAKTTNPFGN